MNDLLAVEKGSALPAFALEQEYKEA